MNQTFCDEILRQSGSDPVVTLWKAFGLIMESKIIDGIRELNTIKDKVLHIYICTYVYIRCAYQSDLTLNADNGVNLDLFFPI